MSEPDPKTRYDVDGERLNTAFTYHKPTGADQVDRYAHLRDVARSFAKEVMHCAPPSREQSLALTKIEEAVMWANAAIARNE